MNQELKVRLLGSAAIEDIVSQATRLIELTSFMEPGDVDRLLQASGLLHEVMVKAETLASLPSTVEQPVPEAPEQPLNVTIIESALRMAIGRDPNPGDLRCAAAIGYPKYQVGQPVRLTVEHGAIPQVRTVQSIDHIVDNAGEFHWGYGFAGGEQMFYDVFLAPVPKS